MNIYEVLGSCFVVYFFCTGLAAHGWFVVAGLKWLQSRLEIGADVESGLTAARLEIRRSAN